MSTIVDEMFPVLPMQELDYNQFIYWRDPVPDFVLGTVTIP